MTRGDVSAIASGRASHATLAIANQLPLSGCTSANRSAPLISWQIAVLASSRHHRNAFPPDAHHQPSARSEIHSPRPPRSVHRVSARFAPQKLLLR